MLKPIEGLSHDTPGGFLGGLNSGAASFLEHVGSGALGSISGFASSVAHNVPTPVGGAIGLVANTGRSLLDTFGIAAAGAPEMAHENRKHENPSSALRFRLKVLDPSSRIHAKLNCKGVGRSGVAVARTLLLTDTAIHVYVLSMCCCASHRSLMCALVGTPKLRTTLSKRLQWKILVRLNAIQTTRCR